MRSIDINVDAGEADGTGDEAFLDVVTSVNVACGVHAGSAETIARLSAAAAAKGVGVGAHPGLPNGGRNAQIVRPSAAGEAVTEQVEKFRRHSKAPLQHVKLHGALYHAARDPRVAKAVAEAVISLGAPILVAQAGSPLETAARERGLNVATEAFLDRAYEPDGRLMSREKPGSVLDDAGSAAERAVMIALERRVVAVNGRDLPAPADTLCVHSDTPHALEIATAARKALERAGVRVRPMGAP